MNKFTFLPFLAASALALTSHGQEASTPPVGFVTVTVPANSDAVLAVPLNRPSAFTGVIQSISGNVVTVSGTPGWTANQFIQSLPTQTNTYALQLASGAKEGMIGLVTAHSTGTNPTITVTLDSSDDFSGVGTVAVPVDPDGAGPLPAQADQIDLTPYWTPSTFMPTSTPDGTEIYILKTSRSGINLGAEAKFIMDGGWIDQDSSAPTGNSPLEFGAAIIVRNNAASALPISAVGSVPMNSYRIKIRNNSPTASQDIAFGYVSPVPEKFLELNLPSVDGDQVLIYDNTASGINKSSINASLIKDGVWTFADSGLPVPASYTLNPGFGYIFRRGATGNTTSVTWQDLQSYLQ